MYIQGRAKVMVQFIEINCTYFCIPTLKPTYPQNTDNVNVLNIIFHDLQRNKGIFMLEMYMTEDSAWSDSGHYE